jgi:hypothetical protein
MPLKLADGSTIISQVMCKLHYIVTKPVQFDFFYSYEICADKKYIPGAGKKCQWNRHLPSINIHAAYIAKGMSKLWSLV